MADIPIPAEVRNAAKAKFLELWETDTPVDEAWDQTIAAALNVWPGMDIAKPLPSDRLVRSRTYTLILPLPTQERRNEA